MYYIKFTYIDSVTGVPVSSAPARNGTTFPNVSGLVFGFALESEYPAKIPIMYGTCETLEEGAHGVISEVSEQVFQDALSAELAARNTKFHNEALTLIADTRWRHETGGIMFGDVPLVTDRTTQAMVTGAALAAVLDPDYTVKWKTTNGFITLNAEQILAMAQAIRTHVQACFDREAELLDALNAGSFEMDMLGDGWTAGSAG